MLTHDWHSRLQRVWSPNWRPKAEHHVEHLSFASAAATRKDRLWDLYHILAMTGVYLDVAYALGPLAHRVNAQHGGGNSHIPSITTSGGASIQWWIESDGRIKVDGRQSVVEELMDRLRDIFPEYVTPTEHSKYTGRHKAKKTMSTQASADYQERKARLEKTRGLVLVAQGTIYDPDGVTGIWDKIHKKVHSSPYHMGYPSCLLNYVLSGIE